MKKLLALVMAFAICLSMASCGKNEAVKAVEEAIAGIGSVTLDSKDQIDEVEAMYEALEEKDQEKVENIAVLEEARSTYDALYEEKVASLAQSAYDDLLFATTHCLFMLDNVSNALSIFNDTGLAPSNCISKLSDATGLSAADLCSGGLGEIDIFFFPGCTVTATKHAYENTGWYEELDTFLANAAAVLEELEGTMDDTVYAPTLNQWYAAINEGYTYFKEAAFSGDGYGPSIYDSAAAADEWNRLSDESKEQISNITAQHEAAKSLLPQ